VVDPTHTHALFDHDRVASGYAAARPYLHPEIFARARELVRPSGRFGRALDVGCGTGLSSLAMLELAEEVVGIDGSTAMLRQARRAPGLRYAAASAEALPFRGGGFELVAACGSLDWVDLARFLPQAAELVAPGGWLVALDFGDTGRSDELPTLARWYDGAFLSRYPRPPARDPMITAEAAGRGGFAAPLHGTFASACPFTAPAYAAFLTTESNLVAAIEYGRESEADALGWLESQLAPIFGSEPHRVLFSGYIQALRRL
jgi:SAM-dependent methyltransferase